MANDHRYDDRDHDLARTARPAATHADVPYEPPEPKLPAGLSRETLEQVFGKRVLGQELPQAGGRRSRARIPAGLTLEDLRRNPLKEPGPLLLPSERTALVQQKAAGRAGAPNVGPSEEDLSPELVDRFPDVPPAADLRARVVGTTIERGMVKLLIAAGGAQGVKWGAAAMLEGLPYRIPIEHVDGNRCGGYVAATIDIVKDRAVVINPSAAPGPTTAGKRSHAVQHRASGEAARESVHDAAARGIASPATALPFREQIQASFGPGHDLSAIQAHVGGDTAAAMGATAYATGDHVVFDRPPDLHTAAHEVAHTVQQRRGIQLTGGVGQAADAFEQHADAVANRVVADQSAADLLAAGGPSGATAAMVQRKQAGSRAGRGPVQPPVELQFKTRLVAFAGKGDRHDLELKNVSDHDITLGGHGALVGDPAFFVGLMPGRVISPGSSLRITVVYEPSADVPQGATLIVHADGGILASATTARIALTGHSSAAAKDRAAGQECGVPIKATTDAGRPNSIGSALGSVAAAWGAVLTEQQGGVTMIQGLARGDTPNEASGWSAVLDDIIAEGLTFAMGWVGGYLGRKLSGIASDLLDRVHVDDGWDLAELVTKIDKLTTRSHALLVNDVTKSIAAQASSSVRAAIAEAMADRKGSVLVREAFFNAQARALTLAATDAVVSVNNLEGDYQVLENERPGMGFAALELYRNHLMCEAAHARDLQANKTLGLWAAYLARLELGTDEPESWEKGVKKGADLEDIYKEKNNHGEWRDDLAKGVLDLRVLWDYDRMTSVPVLTIEHARVRGISDSLKAMLCSAPLKEFSIPLIVHGQVAYRMPSGLGRTSELRVGRNEGGGIYMGAERGKKSADMLELLGGGDAFAGAAKLLNRVGDMQLENID